MAALATPNQRSEFMGKLGDLPKGNKALREELGWKPETYAIVKQALLNDGVIERRKGQGGSVVKIRDLENEAKLKEVAVYEEISSQLKEMWIDDNGIIHDTEIISKITALQGKRDTGGKWSRPDITIVTFQEYEHILLPTLEVITFELKTDLAQMNVACVYEALAQQRSSHKAYVVLVAGNASMKEVESKADDVSEECAKHGIGLIVIDNVTDYATWKIVLDGERHEPDPQKLNDFISQQLKGDVQERIKIWYGPWRKHVGNTPT